VNLGEIIGYARIFLDDELQPYRNSDKELVMFANEAVDEAARRAPILEDNSTPDVCRISLVPGTPTYNLHPSILRVYFVKLKSTQQTLMHRTEHLVKTATFTMSDLNDTPAAFFSPGGFVSTPLNNIAGTPWCYFIRADHTITFSPIPNADDSVDLSVQRMALNQMKDVTDKPEIPYAYHDSLYMWILKRVYEKRDSEQMDLQSSQIWDAKFASIYGMKLPAKVEVNRLVNPIERGSYTKGLGNSYGG
jgi:hypothetical protein